MKLLYPKILLFSLLLNILSHNKNKPYITTHTPTTTSRVLIECNIYMPNYDNDPDMNSVRENFHKQTEQRIHEYDKLMIKNRRKFKEKCDKEIQKIILEDKVKKSLAEKVEKGCLKCGCGLGGVAASVGVLGTAVVNVLKKAAMDAAIGTAIAKGLTEGAAMGATRGVAEVIAGLTALNIHKVCTVPLGSFINSTNYTEASLISKIVNMHYNITCKTFGSGVFSNTSNSMCDIIEKWGLREGSSYVKVSSETSILEKVTEVVTRAKPVAEAAVKTATENITKGAIKTNIAEVNATYAIYQNVIIASTVAILDIFIIKFL
ncbi:PIR protein, putative [Plasmodium sp.]|nr:PIR protein, putative [Plasmodium sp.]SCM18801.1 PIR protein, putative [Plasmodium sp.]